MQGLVLRVNSLLNPLSHSGLKEPVKGGGCIEDDHRSPVFVPAFLLHQASSIELNHNRLALVQTLAQLCQGGPLRDLFDLSQQIVRQRHARHRGARFQSAMQGVRHIPELNHL